jgi:hypothetical protein
MRFSQRMNITPIKTELQIESMDDDLRNGLWNCFDLLFIPLFEIAEAGNIFFNQLFMDHLKLPLDTIPRESYKRAQILREWFFKWAWYDVYDFIEFTVQNNLSKYCYYYSPAKYKNFCNEILERELSGYRIVDNRIAPITNESELREIEQAIEQSKETKLSGVNLHLNSALEKFANRKQPDYRNSIKESISAVESIAKVISGKEKAELGQALKQIEDKVGLHAALKKGFLAIYGYTSDADGIRHAMIDESTSDFEDAKYMLVSCSAFINYLIMKATKAGIL